MRARRLIPGEAPGIPGTLYGTIIVMATLAAGSRGGATETGHLAAIVAVTVLVLWIAHVYSHVIGESLAEGRRLDRAEFVEIARREWSIPAAGVAPVFFLVLGGLDVIEEQPAVWLALASGIAILAIVGARYARIERFGRLGTAVSVAVNVLLGLVIVALEVLLAH
jgi:hypothetical protein